MRMGLPRFASSPVCSENVSMSVRARLANVREPMCACERACIKFKAYYDIISLHLITSLPPSIIQLPEIITNVTNCKPSTNTMPHAAMPPCSPMPSLRI